MDEINAEFGLGNNLGAYRGASYKKGTLASKFTNTNLSFNQFY